MGLEHLSLVFVFDVSFKEKEDAKKYGLRWNPEEKHWYRKIKDESGSIGLNCEGDEPFSGDELDMKCFIRFKVKSIINDSSFAERTIKQVKERCEKFRTNYQLHHKYNMEYSHRKIKDTFKGCKGDITKYLECMLNKSDDEKFVDF